MFHRHKWLSWHNLDFEGVYLLFVRHFGKAKLQYCMRCGAIRFVGLDEKDG